MPKVSIDVVIPCYRYGRFLRQSVESVLSQDVAARVLVIDDCSPDDSAEVCDGLAGEYPQVAFRRHVVNAGHIDTYNEGIAWASSPYFLLLSADDYLTAGALRRSLDLLERRPDVGFVFGDVLEEDAAGGHTPMRPLEGRLETRAEMVIETERFLRASGGVNIVSTPSAVVRTPLQKKIGGYRKDLPHSADMAMWWRFASLANVGFIDDFQAVYRRHGHNMSAQYDVGHRLPDLLQRRDAMRHVFGQPEFPLSERFQSDVYRTLGLHAISYASQALNAGNQEAAAHLLRFVADDCPAARRSWPWIKVTLKRAIGHRVWSAMGRQFS
jgi:glycosyltransferase involved in cell wall biosynthesis